LLSLRAPSKNSNFSLMGTSLVGCEVPERQRPGALQGATTTAVCGGWSTRDYEEHRQARISRRSLILGATLV